MDYGEKKTDGFIDDLERRIVKEYKTALKEVREKYDNFSKKFAEDDAQKKKELSEGKITGEQYKAWRQKQLMTGKHWYNLLDILAEDLTKVDKKVASMSGEYLPEAYAVNCNYITYEIEKNLRIDTSFTLYSRETVEKLLKDTPTLLPKPRVDIPKDKLWNKKHINSAILQGVLQGDDIDTISRRLQSVTDMDRRAAVRNARTMMIGAQNSGRMDAFRRAKALGIDIKKRWIATLDHKTRDSHANLDGEIVDVEEKFSNGLMFPGDSTGEPSEVYNCRCKVLPYYPEYEDENLTRLDNVTKQRIEFKTYNEWARKKKQEETDEERLERQRAYNKSVKDKIKSITDALNDTNQDRHRLENEIREAERDKKLINEDYSAYDRFATEKDFKEYIDKLQKESDDLYEEKRSLKRPKFDDFAHGNAADEDEYNKAFEKYLRQKSQIQERIDEIFNEIYELHNGIPNYSWDTIERWRVLQGMSNEQKYIEDKISDLKAQLNDVLLKHKDLDNDLTNAYKMRKFNEAWLVDEAENLKVKFAQIQESKFKLTEEGIINVLAGGDRTSGSCVSLAYCYAARKSGYDVLDFRGGDSQHLFARNGDALLQGIAEETGKKLYYEHNKKEIRGAIKLLSQMQEGHEYYFTTGHHAAITRRTKDESGYNVYEYLELQSGRSNGWKLLGYANSESGVADNLKWRFAANKTVEGGAFMMDIEDMKDSKLLWRACGYMNTEEYAQKKGASGSVK